ncbi:MAG: hypothetical protein RLZZ26_416 [Candidatus Parcubacteria bacterium]|jgi:hypothetical protein
MQYINKDLRVPLLDAIDRYTIIELKSERLANEADRQAVTNEFHFYQQVLDAYRRDGIEIKPEWLTQMKEMNARIWDTEASIRNARRAGLTDTAVGELAVQLRDLNDKRGAIRRKHADAIGCDFFDITPEVVPGTNLQYALPLHEAIDRFTITELYHERLPDSLGSTREYPFYKRLIDTYRANGITVEDRWVESMHDMNGRVWDKEGVIRQRRETFGLDELGRRTLDLREMSKERVARKNVIASEAKLSFYEVKTETV